MADKVEPYTPPAEGEAPGAPQVTDDVIKSMAAKSGDSEDHIRKMLNIADKGVEGAKETPQLAGKFASEADLDKGIQSLIDKYGKETAYKMLEGQLGNSDKGDPTPTDTKPAEGDALNTDKPAEGDSKPADTPATPDFDKLGQEFAENGKLSEASYADLQKMGLPKEMVDQYIAGMEAQASVFDSKVYEAAGGEQQYDAMIEWAKDGLTAAEKTKFNAALQSMNVDEAAPVIEALKARYTKAEGSFSRKRVEGSESINGSTAVGYKSTAEMSADMRDPRYVNHDKAFHAYVQARMAKSTF